jgi:hypothetical protein
MNKVGLLDILFLTDMREVNILATEDSQASGQAKLFVISLGE